MKDKLTDSQIANIRAALDAASDVVEAERAAIVSYLLAMAHGLGDKGYLESRDTLQFVADKINNREYRP